MISLVILAAGFGSRFKGGVKQDYPVLDGYNLMDYSISNAYYAGFKNFVFLIRKDMKEFEEKIRYKYKNYSISFVYQDVLDIPCSINYERIKPWGTAHAVYSLRSSIKDAFCIINSDDYYGINSFMKMYEFLSTNSNSNMYATVGYKLINTLSLNGKVNRGILNVDNGYVTSIKEIKGIDYDTLIDLNSLCSVGIYGFNTSIFKKLEEKFVIFLKNSKMDDEFMLTDVLDSMNDIKIKALTTNDNYFGITYIEDVFLVAIKLKKELDDDLSKFPLFELEKS